MKAAVSLLKALADPTRWRVVATLRRRELCVCELCDALEMTQSSLSTHLIVLRDARVVKTRKEGRWIYYSLNPANATLVEIIVAHDKKAFAGDARLKRDATRIKRRLKMRENGSCVLGFSQLNGSRKSRA